jgi:hypothetical protein
MATCDSGFAKQIDGMLTDGEMPAGAWKKLRDHLQGCADCRDRYNRVSLAERMLHGGPAKVGTISPSALDRICGAVVAPEGASRGLFALPRWVFGLVAIGAAAAVLPFVLKIRHSGSTDEFAVRGTRSDPTQQAGLRAFCLYNDVVRPLEDEPNATLPQCSAANLLKLTYTNRAGYEELFLVGVDEKYEVKWYEPRPPSTLSVPLTRGVDQPIAGAIRLGVNHEAGPVRIFALFAHAPIAAREVEDAVAELKRSATNIREVPKLPLSDRDDVLQRSVIFEVTGAH